MSSVKNDEIQTQEIQGSWRDILLPKQSSSKKEELKKVGSTNSDIPNRKSKILGSLAFLAGLSIGGLTSATSTVKTYAKPPPVTLNFDASRVSPHIGPIYGPYPYVSHPYIFATPLGLYSILNPLSLQPIGGIQNDLQALTQHTQVLNLLDNKKPNDLLNNNEEYIDVAKKVENVKTSNTVEEEASEGAESQFADDRNAEEEMLKPGTICSKQKGYKMKQSTSLRDESVEREGGWKDSLVISSFRAKNRTRKNSTLSQLPENGTVVFTTTTKNMENSTVNDTTTSAPFYGYYGGYPQDIHHIAFTTETNEYKYHDYDPVNYNLPSYGKPANFHSDERYNYYAHPPPDSSVTNEFPQEQIPEYFSHDFNRYLYTPYNTPPFANSGFRPVV
ncbi:PREDICTED: uncharacterized protein LOC107193464 [Dufourea novaeangliae]|uniref:uncharacterized protein LOC107193464 n=1 Tax=Dufourea novaeangliae TaxID=178035 RepID=UPI000767C852|nr:PREDICTED: uncharacterized protein LOC107193464 [Dufourea novaeangliae]